MSIYFYIILALILFGFYVNMGRRPFGKDDLQKNFNLNKYVDKQKWYQYAFIPNWFQRDCDNNATAEYNFTSEDKDEISVINKCKTKKGILKVASGFAYPYGKEGNKLKVSFAPEFLSYVDKFLQQYKDLNYTTGDYYIIDSDSETYAMVGSTDRKYLWILVSSLDKKLNNYNDLVDKAKKLGFDTEKIEISELN